MDAHCDLYTDCILTSPANKPAKAGFLNKGVSNICEK